MKTIIALALITTGCAFRTLDHAGGAPDQVPALPPKPVEIPRPCGQGLRQEERARITEASPLYGSVWAASSDGVIWHADRASGTTHRLANGADTVIPFGGAAVNVSDSGRVIVTSWRTNSVYEIFGTNAVLIAGSGVAGHADGPADVAAFDMPVSISFTEDGGVAVHDVGNLAIRKVLAGQVTTLRCTAKE